MGRYLDNGGRIPNGSQVESGAGIGFGYTVGRLDTSIGALVGIGLMFRVFAMMVLVYRTRPKTFRKDKGITTTTATTTVGTGGQR